jgi:hypothetical protein
MLSVTLYLRAENKLNYIMKKMKRLIYAAGFLCAVLVLNGCGDSPPASTDNGDNMEVGFAESPLVEHAPSDTLIITSVKALISNVELYQSYNSEYQTVKADPIVVDLTPGVGYEKIGSGVIANGIYQRVRFQFHQPDVDEVISDPDFNTGSSISERQSLIVKGTYHGIAFTYKMHESLPPRELFFPGNVELDINPLSVTILYNPELWFKSTLNLYLDPANIENVSVINTNIVGSFRRAFIDGDHNGSPDQ